MDSSAMKESVGDWLYSQVSTPRYYLGNDVNHRRADPFYRIILKCLMISNVWNHAQCVKY